YDVFGFLLSSFGHSFSHLFAGEENDLTALLYLRARYYDPYSGRFLSRDAWSGDASNTQSVNHYVYALNNPVNNLDPTGQYAILDDLAFAGAGLVTALASQRVIDQLSHQKSSGLTYLGVGLGGVLGGGGTENFSPFGGGN